MKPSPWVRLGLSALAVWMACGATAGTRESASARAFLTGTFNLSKSDLDRVDAGQVVTRTLDAADKREVATLGVVRIRITPEFYVDRFQDIVSFKKNEAVLQIGTLGNPPAVAEMAGMTLDEHDVRHLRRCRVGDCGVQLPAAVIGRFQTDVDWTKPDAHRQAERLLRHTLVDYAATYLKAGAGAAIEYADETTRVHLGREWTSLMGTDVPGWKTFPALRQYLADFPASDVPGTIDRLYWSKEKVSRRTVVSVTHLAIMKTSTETPADYAIASRQIFATHYFDASLGLTVLVRDRSAPAPTTYLTYLNRSRVDVFGGLFGGVTRHIVSSKARGTVEDLLGRLQRSLEKQFAASRLPPLQH
jgi:hypothetical protein